MPMKQPPPASAPPTDARFVHVGFAHAGLALLTLALLALTSTAGRAADAHLEPAPETTIRSNTEDVRSTDHAAPDVSIESVDAAIAPLNATNASDGSTGLHPAGESGWPPRIPVLQRFQRGWPVEIGMSIGIPWGVALADVDNDRDLEVLAGSSTGLFWMWQHDGTPLPGWPVDFGASVIGKTAVADLDLDGDLEMIFVVKTPPLARVEVRHHDGTSLTGWPQFTEGGYGPVMPSIYDLDGDGSPEVLWGNVSGIVAWHADGSRVSWYPARLPGNVSATLAIGDLDGDGSPEILATTVDPDDDFATYVNVIHADGRPARGWPFYDPHISGWGAPSMGDLDGDGALEALAMTSEIGSGEPAASRLFAFDANGRVRDGFPLVTNSPQSYSSPTLADIDHDGDLEIFQTTKAPGYAVFGWDHLGNELPGWPVHGSGILGPGNLECSPVVANFDRDAELEVTFADNLSPGNMFGHNPDGSFVAGFPYWALPGIASPSSPAVGDVDLDGDLEIAMTMYPGVVGVWDLGVPWDPTRAGWPTNFHDNWNTNQHGFVPPDEVDEVARVEGRNTGLSDTVDAPGHQNGHSTASFGLVPAGLRITPNPGRQDLRIGFSIGTATHGSLSIYDTGGRLLRAWSGLEVPADGVELAWNARNLHGDPVPAGIYQARFRADGSPDAAGDPREWSASITLLR